ncbi:unnamed protein product [Calicophoron daubneyi]|uniref:VOC domain-containing protein n=1 Tax=Calicophoron daubneyi TaxID=300641 RepID=A0AAV2TJC5_CALDB
MSGRFQSVLKIAQRFVTGKPWKVTGLNHVAIAVPNVEKAAQFYRETYGLEVDPPKKAEAHGVCFSFVHMGNTKIELISPLNDKSPIAKFMEKNKNGGIHHICIEVDKLDPTIASLKEKNIRFTAPEPKIGASGVPVIFAHPKDTQSVLTEFEATHQKK